MPRVAPTKRHIRLDLDVLILIDRWRDARQRQGIRLSFNNAVNSYIRTLSNGRKS